MIEVRIPLAFFAQQGNEIHQGMGVAKRLREAGVPAVGELHVRGVAQGALTVFDDEMFGERVYRWTPEVQT